MKFELRKSTNLEYDFSKQSLSRLHRLSSRLPLYQIVWIHTRSTTSCLKNNDNIPGSINSAIVRSDHTPGDYDQTDPVEVWHSMIWRENDQSIRVDIIHIYLRKSYSVTIRQLSIPWECWNQFLVAGCPSWPTSSDYGRDMHILCDIMYA